MKLSEIRGEAAATANPTPVTGPDEPAVPSDVPARNGVDGNGAVGDVQQSTKPAVEEPWGVANVVAPNGIEIYYQAGPKRLYRIRSKWDDSLESEESWQEVPSVSKVLDCLEKGGLSVWGQRIGVEGVLALLREGEMPAPTDTSAVLDVLKAKKLTVHYVKGAAADRGTNVHSALEAWVETGITPNPSLFPENEQGYVKGLVKFINDAHPHPLHSELMVASMKGFAGRFDLLANLDFAGEVVTKTYPKRKEVRTQISGAWLLDLKTSKAVYPSYHLQLAAYREAMTECGYGTAGHAGVVRVTDDGRYELVESRATFQDFLHVLNTYHVIQGLKK